MSADAERARIVNPTLSPSAGQFLQTCIPSPMHLEVLLLLRRDAGRWWSAEGIAEPLRVAPASAVRALEDLGACNLLDVRIGSNVMYRFAPVDPALVPVIDEIAAVHSVDPQAVGAVTRAGRRPEGPPAPAPV